MGNDTSKGQFYISMNATHWSKHIHRKAFWWIIFSANRCWTKFFLFFLWLLSLCWSRPKCESCRPISKQFELIKNTDILFCSDSYVKSMDYYDSQLIKILRKKFFAYSGVFRLSSDLNPCSHPLLHGQVWACVFLCSTKWSKIKIDIKSEEVISD